MALIERMIGSMYVRFEASTFNPKTGRNIGIFGVLTNILEDSSQNQKFCARSHRYLSWFSSNLSKPNILKLEADELYGTSWFRGEATKHIFYAEEICKILNSVGVETTCIQAVTMDKVIYSDENQVVAGASSEVDVSP